MGVNEHNRRSRIFNQGQHPYRHSPAEIAYTNDAVPSATSLQSALDWLFAVLYPRAQDAVATPGDLPSVGNTLLDYRVVLNDGDNKAASYRWEQREGDVAAKWYKIYDMDWGEGTVLSNLLLKTQDVYVYRHGIDDKDDTGTALTGVNAGQHIYGGASASTHLTLHANAGDGTGSQTGYVQFTDNIRPTTNNAWDFGTAALKFKTGYFATSMLIGDLTLSNGSIVSSSGAISFDNENLSTTGTLSAGAVTFSSGSFGTLSLASASITDSSGAISFDNENLTTTGSVTAGSFVRGTLTIGAASITDSSGAISFDNENLSTTGTLAAGNTTVTRLDCDNLRLDANTLSSTSGALNLLAATVVDIQSAMTTIGQTVTGTMAITGQLNADNLRIDGNTLSSTDTNGSIALSPDGSGLVTTSAKIQPTTDGTLDLGATGNRWNSIYLDNSLGDGTNTITIATLLSFRDALSGASSGMTLFYDGSKWNASVPDTEVDHGTISGLSDDDHTQYLLLAGRSGGQSVVGGTAASNNLTFESTSNGTKGKVLTKDTFAANTDASYTASWAGADLGGSSNRFRHVYTAGEYFGLRLENIAGDATPAASAVGRLWWNTTSAYVGLDTGTVVKRVSLFRYEEDTTWDGSTSTKNVTVSGIDATKAIWVLKDNSNDYEQLFVTIKATSTTNVRIVTNVSLPAGSYRLVGIQ